MTSAPTSFPTTPPAPDPVGPYRPTPAAPVLRVSRLWWFTAPVLFLLVAALIFLAARPLPYFTYMPGSARSVEPLITVSAIGEGPVPFDDEVDDDLLFVTVSVRRPFGAEVLYRLTSDVDEVVPEKQVTGGQTREENTQFNLQMMTDSKDKAVKVALERAGYTVETTSIGAVITDLVPTYPVAEVVRPGDTIVAADGKPVTTSDEVKAAIAAHAPGDDIELTVLPIDGTAKRTVSARLVENPETAGAAQLGVSLQDRPKFTFPVQVDIDSGKVGGPSAGLSFTLAILDRLTPGNLTGDAKVAVTGTIELDGTVGPVGGVVQKTEAAVDAGAELFIVPNDEFADAVRAAKGRLEVRQVASLDEALAVLQDVGGDPLPAATD